MLSTALDMYEGFFFLLLLLDISADILIYVNCPDKQLIDGILLVQWIFS